MIDFDRAPTLPDPDAPALFTPGIGWNLAELERLAAAARAELLRRMKPAGNA